MSVHDSSSLLNFLDAPIVVGDPEGRVIFVNPAFTRIFGTEAEDALGEALAGLFSGGGREAILGAVAAVCSSGETSRFRLRESHAGFLGLASPIEAGDNRVGVMILLFQEPGPDHRLLALQNEIEEPLDEAAACFEEVLEQTGGRRAERHRAKVEQGMAALERARKWNDELQNVLCSKGTKATAGASLDPVRVLRQVAARLGPEFQSGGVALHLLVPASLPVAAGDPALLETALAKLARDRLAQAARGGAVTLTARAAMASGTAGVVLSVVDQPAGECSAIEPDAVRTTVAALGGRVCTLAESGVGRATTIRLGLAQAS